MCKSRWMLGLLMASIASISFAQNTITRYMPMTGSLMPFELPVAPVEEILLSVDADMHYGATVTTVNAAWSFESSADSYKLELRNLVIDVWEQIYIGPATLHIVNDLDVGQRYFRVTVCSAGVCDGVSDTKSIFVVENDDYDQDGIIDRLDLCPESDENATVTAHGCVATTADSDNDGYTDDLDWCDFTDPTADDIDDRGCTPDQVDSDDDGTPDYLDNYPYQHSSQCTG